MTDNVPTPSPAIGVVLLGDEITTVQQPQLTALTAVHGRTIVHHSTFPVGALSRPSDLAAHRAVVDAGAVAAAKGSPVWVPDPGDLGCEDNLRRLDLALRAAGVTLLIGPNLEAIPMALSPLDRALRLEVVYVQELTAAIAAAAAVTPMVNAIVDTLKDEAPALTEAHDNMTWEERADALARYARHLIGAGRTRAEIADHFNNLGYRTRRGRPWTGASITRLVAAVRQDSSTSLDAAA